MEWEKMSEQIGGEKIVVYDLGSENRREFGDGSIKNKVRTARIICVQLLHSLGIQCTESVVIVPHDHAELIGSVIEKVNFIYQELNEELRRQGLTVQLRPIVQVLELTTDQVGRLIPIAQRRLIENLDRTIDSVSEIIDELVDITEEARLRRIRNNLRRLANNWSHINDMARRLGIDLSRDYETLVELIDEALERCQ
jgi:uncharacterized protein YqgV (UPF0045/DUF77 family)